MTNGLCKERMTVFFNRGTVAYQAFSQFGRTKILKYYLIDQKYVNSAEQTIPVELNQEEFENLAKHLYENEIA